VSDRSCRPLPLRIDDIDASWLSLALRTRVPQAAVESFEIVDVKRSTCTKIRLRLVLNEAATRAGIPDLVILKGGFEPHSREMGHMHEREVHAYRDLQPDLKLHMPASYFADYDAEGRQGIVVMEDLVVRGVSFCNPLVPQSHDEVARRLSMLAQHHARSWASPHFNPAGKWAWMEQHAHATRHYMSHYLEPATWRRFVDSPRGAAVAMRFTDSAWMADALDRLVLLEQDLPHCAQHGDTHLGNLYVEQDGTPGFFDSVPDRSYAMMEIAYHLACALDMADRRRWEAALVQHYLDELKYHGVDAPAFDDAMFQYSVSLAIGYLIFLINESFFQIEAINTAYTARFSAAMLDNDTAGKLKAIV
jgi:hypothetical protein